MDLVKINQKVIANIAGVSRSTVSGVINGDPRINVHTRRRVQKIIEDTGYHPNAAARSLVSAKANSIGVCFYDTSYISIPQFSGIMQGILEVANVQGYAFMLTTTLATRDMNNLNILKSAVERRIDGAIICDDIIDRDILGKLQDMNFPFVMVDRNARINPNIPRVCTDYYKGVKLAVTHLIELGHTRIGLLITPGDSSFAFDKISAYKNTLEKAGIEFDKNLIMPINPTNCSSLETIVNDMLDYGLSLNPRPTAMIFQNDENALMAIRILLNRGYRIPGDFSIVGTGDIPNAVSIKPSLSTIHINTYEMGRNSARILLQIIEEGRCDVKDLIVPTEFIPRESTGSVPKLV